MTIIAMTIESILLFFVQITCMITLCIIFIIKVLVNLINIFLIIYLLKELYTFFFVITLPIINILIYSILSYPIVISIIFIGFSINFFINKKQKRKHNNTVINKNIVFMS